MGSTVLHVAARWGSDEFVRDLIYSLNRDHSERLSAIRDRNHKTPIEWTSYGLKQDYLHQAGSILPKIYPLNAPPTVLIFYTTEDRPGAEDETAVVVNYFQEKGIHCVDKRNPTVSGVFESISNATENVCVSALVVFLMSHGKEHTAAMKDGAIGIGEVISHMCDSCRDKQIPKVCSQKVLSSTFHYISL